MKRAVILHGTDGSPQENWFLWLKEQLEERKYEVWLPQLPDAHEPNAKRYTDFLISSGWNFQDNLLIGHSSGAVEILHLLQHLSEGITIETAVLVSAFPHTLAEEPGWQQLKDLFEEPFDFTKIRDKAGQFLFVHGDNDPWCNPKQAENMAKALSAEFILLPQGQHFSASLDPVYTQFPELIRLLEERQYV